MRTIKLSFVLTILLFTSCHNTWDKEDKDAFYQSCYDEAKTTASVEKAKSYCTCMTNKMMEKYPDENDALEHMDSVISDPELQKCKEALK